MKVGLALPHYDFSFPDGRSARIHDVVAYARRAEELGFDSVWVSDHLFLDLAKYGGPPQRFRTPEAMTMLTAVAASTNRVRFGSLVLCSSFRHPAVLAAQASSLDEMSDRRFDLGVGAGWYEPEFNAAGIQFGTAGQRIERLRAIAGQLDARLDPRPPIWIGGKGGPKLMSVVAEHGDGWNLVWQITTEEYRDRLDVLRAACAKAGRDPAGVSLSVGLSCLVGSDDVDLRARFEGLRRWSPGDVLTEDLEAYARGRLVGTPDECTARIKEFEALGVEHFILNLGSVPFSVYDDEQLELVARELLPRVR
jgi:alkanesulfonate monooxygenase SsuD/methylene tetrahydromethanopterin reductase-like flavin-dependent oxidoreductase (luciferase family)